MSCVFVAKWWPVASGQFIYLLWKKNQTHCWDDFHSRFSFINIQEVFKWQIFKLMTWLSSERSSNCQVRNFLWDVLWCLKIFNTRSVWQLRWHGTSIRNPLLSERIWQNNRVNVCVVTVFSRDKKVHKYFCVSCNSSRDLWASIRGRLSWTSIIKDILHIWYNIDIPSKMHHIFMRSTS